MCAPSNNWAVRSLDPRIILQFGWLTERRKLFKSYGLISNGFIWLNKAASYSTGGCAPLISFKLSGSDREVLATLNGDSRTSAVFYSDVWPVWLVSGCESISSSGERAHFARGSHWKALKRVFFSFFSFAFEELVFHFIAPDGLFYCAHYVGGA